jgi:hypothetical protein
LNSTKDVTLRWMQLSNFDNAAIVGRSVLGFQLLNSVVDGVNGNAGGLTEGALLFGAPNPGGVNGLLGTAIIRDTLISGGGGNNVAVYNQSGSLTMQVDGAVGANPPQCRITNNSAVTGLDGLIVQLEGSATGTVTVDSCQFRNNRGSALQAIARDNAVLGVSANRSAFVHSDWGERGVVATNAGNAQVAAVVSNSTFSSLPGANVWLGQAPGNASALSLLRASISGNDMGQVAGATESTVVARLSGTAGQVARARILIHDNFIISPVLEAIAITTPDAATLPALDLTLTNNHVDLETAGPRSVRIESTQPGATLCARVGIGPAGHLPYLGNLFHWLPTLGNGGPSRFGQGNGATFRLERGVETVSATPLAVLQANDSAAGLQPLYEIAGTLTVVENGTCQAP